MKMRLFYFTLVSFILLSTFQNCSSQVDFEKIPYVAKVFVPYEREEKVSVQSSLNNTQLKVMFIVDNSGTMSASQTYLSQGVSNLLKSLQGLNVEFLVSPINIDMNSPSYPTKVGAVSPSLFASRGESTAGLSAGSLAKYVTKETNSMGYDVTTYKLALAENMARVSINNKMNEAQFNSSISTLTSSIINVGASQLSMNEKGRCLLAYQLAKSAENGFFKKGDIGIVVLISDEDDASDKCETEIIRTTKEATTTITMHNVLKYRYNGPSTVSIHYTWDDPCFEGTKLCPQSNYQNYDKCYSEYEFRQLNSWATTAINFKITRCENIPSSVMGGSIRVSAAYPDCATLVAKFPNYYNCTPGTESVTNYDNNGYSNTTIKYITDGVSATIPEPERINHYLTTQIKSLFGESNFYMAGIYNTGGCPTIGEQAVGAKYTQLLNHLKSNSINVTSQSICTNDYSPTLKAVSKYAQKTIASSYKISYDSEKEIIKEFSIIRGNVKLSLDEGADYTLSGSHVTFTKFELQPTDTIYVMYEQIPPPPPELDADGYPIKK